MAIDHSAGHWLVETVKAMVGVSEPARDTTGTVTRTDPDGTVWVRLAGSTDATPCVRTSASVKPGDVVNVHVEKNRATIVGNYTSPATDDSMANDALKVGSSAKQIADKSRQMAESAISDAERAKEAADSAVADAATAKDAADDAKEMAQEVADNLEQAVQDAADAKIAAEQAATDAASAASSASSALQSATKANVAAISALDNLSDVVDVLGMVNWVTEHGQWIQAVETSPVEGRMYYIKSGSDYQPVNGIPPSYVLTSDIAVVEGKTYYTRSGEAGAYVYTPVAEPVTADIATYYEQTVGNPAEFGYWYISVDESVQNYIASHLVQTNHGLNLLVDDTDSRIHIGTRDGNHPMGTYIIDGNGNTVANFTEDGTTVGSLADIHVEIRGSRMSFMASGYSLPDDMTGHDPTTPFPGEIAFLAVDPATNQSMFYMNRSVVVNDLYFGKWQWRSRSNENMTLTWVGGSVD